MASTIFGPKYIIFRWVFSKQALHQNDPESGHLLKSGCEHGGQVMTHLSANGPEQQGLHQDDPQDCQPRIRLLGVVLLPVLACAQPL